MNKTTRAKLELEEKKLELQERRAFLKEAKEKLEFERTYISLQKAAELRNAISTVFIKNDGVGSTSNEYGFSDEEFMFLIKKYYTTLKAL